MRLYKTGPLKSNPRANDITQGIYHQGHGRRGTQESGWGWARGAALAWEWVREMLCFNRNRKHAEPQNQVIKRGSAKGDPIWKRVARNLGELKPNHSTEERREGFRGSLKGG